MIALSILAYLAIGFASAVTVMTVFSDFRKMMTDGEPGPFFGIILLWPAGILVGIVVGIGVGIYHGALYISRAIVPDPAKDDPE